MHARLPHLLWLDRRSHADHPRAALVPWLLPAKYVAAQAAALHTQHNLICKLPRYPWSSAFRPCTSSQVSALRHTNCLHKNHSV